MPRKKTEKKTTPKKTERRGRPRKAVDWDLVRQKAMEQCTQEEVAAWADCCVDTLHTAAKRDLGGDFSEIFERWRLSGLPSLRHALWVKGVEEKDPTIMKHVARHYLGQVDRTQVESKVELELKSAADDAREKLAQILGGSAKGQTQG